MAPEYFPYTTGRFTSMLHCQVPQQSSNTCHRPLRQGVSVGRVQARNGTFQLSVTVNTSETVQSLGRSSTLGNQVSTLGLKEFSVFR